MKKEKVLGLREWMGIKNGSINDYMKYLRTMSGEESVVDRAFEESAKEINVPAKEWHSLGGQPMSNTSEYYTPTFDPYFLDEAFAPFSKPVRKASTTKNDYNDVTKVNDGRICELIMNMGSSVYKLSIQSNRIDGLEKAYSGYGARQLYYNIDKEEGDLTYITACSTLLGLQLHVSNIENKMNREEIEKINNLNSRTLSLDNEGNDAGFEENGRIRATIGARPGNYRVKPMVRPNITSNNRKFKGPNNTGLQKSGEGTSGDNSVLLQTYFIGAKQYVKVRNSKYGDFWMRSSEWFNGVRSPTYLGQDVYDYLSRA